MIVAAEQPRNIERKPAPARPRRYTGDVVYIYAFDVAYTVFCMDSPLVSDDGAPLSAESWLQANRRPVAALLTQEPDIAHLSKQEADESTGRYLSYYERDLVVVDWDAALLVDERQNFD